MRRNMFRRAVVTVLVASLGLSQPVASLAMEGNTTSGIEEVAENDGIDKALSVTGASDGEEILTDNIPEPGLKGDVSKINDPRTDDGVSTWDCIWFGRYWQEDTNGDGHCFERDTTVTRHEPDLFNHPMEYYIDQDGNELYEFGDEEKTYPADDKQPIKWRVLDVDENGNALLLADKLIDIVQYNETNENVTWKTSTMRSYLNGYGADENVCKKDFSKKSFASEAFTDNELNSIKRETVENPDNPVYNTEAGDPTEDRIFCLSLGEAMNENYGFQKNVFTQATYSEKKHFTDNDPTRVAYSTRFTDEKPGYVVYTAGKSGFWWLRSPGQNSKLASFVSSYGAAYADFGSSVSYKGYCVRPAFRMNLSTSSSLWSYAGTVSSDGTSDTVVEGLKGARTDGEVSTWDCIWFGRYWQEDTNGDGHCFSEDTVVTKHDGEYYYQDGKKLYNFSGEEGTYCHDEKQPIKWRVLDIDENGNALLLSDKLIDIVQYNEKNEKVTWETCTMRSYLNCYESFSSSGFLKKAFTDKEINAIITSEVLNENNPVYGTAGGNDTSDKIFCLSIEEAMNSNYGFLKNEFTKPPSSDPMFFTDGDSSRVAKTTRFTGDKPGYTADTAGESDWWWLRSLGQNLFADASVVNSGGYVHALGYNVSSYDRCVRPAFRMNLASSKSLWRWAGTVTSDGSVKETIGCITLSSNAVVEPGKSLTLDYELFPWSENLIDKDLTWTTSDDSIASITSAEEVNEKGKGSITVSGLKEGSTEITAIAKMSGVTASCNILVQRIAVDGVSLPGQAELTLKEGETEMLKPVISPANATFQNVTWKSSDESVATVSENGLVKAVSKGTATITVWTDDGGHEAKSLVTVVRPVKDVSLPLNPTIKVGESVTLKPVITPEGATDQKVSWRSSVPGVASVDDNGVVKGLTPGTSVIEVKTHDGGKTAECLVTVIKKDEPGPEPKPEEDLEKDIDVDTEDLKLTMLPGEVRRLPINKTGKYVYGVSYTSSDKKLVTVKNGVVTAKNLKKGDTEKKATVTVEYCGTTKYFDITVTTAVDGKVPENTVIQDGKKKYKITAPKTMNLKYGTDKSASIGIPAQLRNTDKTTITCNIVTGGVCEIAGNSQGEFKLSQSDLGLNTSGSKAKVGVKPLNSGATYVIWSMKDDKGTTQAVTKVIVKKPVDDTLSINRYEAGLDLDVGEGRRLIVLNTKDNTDTKDLSFSVKMKSGKGITCSKSGFITASSSEKAEAVVTVKSGKIKKDITVRCPGRSENVFSLKWTSVITKKPKNGAKAKNVTFKVLNPKKNPPAFTLSVDGNPNGITPGTAGKISVSDAASPGCYTVIATPDETTPGYNIACCEMIIK